MSSVCVFIYFIIRLGYGNSVKFVVLLTIGMFNLKKLVEWPTDTVSMIPIHADALSPLL